MEDIIISIIESQVNLDPEFAEIVQTNFWELI